MKKRALTSFFILIAFICVIYLRKISTYIFDVAFLAVAIVSCLEVSRALKKNNTIPFERISVIYPILLYLGLFIGLIAKLPFYFYIIYYPFVIFAVFMINFIGILIFPKKDTTKSIASKNAFDKAFNSLIVLIYPALLFVPIFFLNHLHEFNALNESFAAITGGLEIFALFMLLSTIVSTVFSDTFAYVVGSLVKGPKLCPKISPKKTISGAIGGLVFSLIGTLILFLIFDKIEAFSKFFMAINGQTWHIIVLGLVGSVASQVGDMFASQFKRKTFIKDFGGFLPGHGGALDRVDGLIFNGVFVFILTLLMIL